MSAIGSLLEKKAELQSKLVDVLTDMERIKGQLSRAKQTTAETGNYSNTKWFKAANAALGHRKIEHQNILSQLSSLKSQIHEEQKAEGFIRAQTFERLFMKVAQRELSKKKYQSLIDATHLEKNLQA